MKNLIYGAVLFFVVAGCNKVQTTDVHSFGDGKRILVESILTIQHDLIQGDVDLYEEPHLYMFNGLLCGRSQFRVPVHLTSKYTAPQLFEKLNGIISIYRCNEKSIS